MSYARLVIVRVYLTYLPQPDPPLTLYLTGGGIAQQCAELSSFGIPKLPYKLPIYLARGDVAAANQNRAGYIHTATTTTTAAAAATISWMGGNSKLPPFCSIRQATGAVESEMRALN